MYMYKPYTFRRGKTNNQEFYKNPPFPLNWFHFQTPIVFQEQHSHHAFFQFSLRDQLVFLDHRFTLSYLTICKLCRPVLIATHCSRQFLGSAIYNLYFSPLAKYPGPFFAKISSWPNFYHTLGGDRHIWLWRCHQIYGICSPLETWKLSWYL